jgi:hypothetical protein
VFDTYQECWHNSLHCSLRPAGQQQQQQQQRQLQFARSLVHSELSWWGLKSSLHLHAAHMHYGGHYSFSYFINSLHCLFLEQS